MYYISFDPFSLINKKFEASCGMEEKESNNFGGKFKSISISDTGIAANELYSPSSKPKENIITALKLLKDKQKTPKVHFLVDEFNSELLCKKYSTQFADGLKTNFKDSTVVIALQSVRKDRSIIRSSDNQNNFQTEAMDMEPLKNAGVKEFVLKSSVRMASQLHEMQSHLEAEAEKSQFKAPLTFEDPTDIGWFLFTITLTYFTVFVNLELFVSTFIYTTDNDEKTNIKEDLRDTKSDTSQEMAHEDVTEYASVKIQNTTDTEKGMVHLTNFGLLLIFIKLYLYMTYMIYIRNIQPMKLLG